MYAEVKVRWGVCRLPYFSPKRNPCLIMPEEFKWRLSSLLVVIRNLVSSAVEALDFFP